MRFKVRSINSERYSHPIRKKNFVFLTEIIGYLVDPINFLHIRETDLKNKTHSAVRGKRSYQLFDISFDCDMNEDSFLFFFFFW